MSEADAAAPPQAEQGAPSAEQGAAPGAAPKHLYDAVSTQRDHVLGSFDAERAAILQAVADQREAAMGPVRTVQARQAAQLASGALGGVGHLPPGVGRQQLVAADIVAALKAMVVEEVRLQIAALLQAAARREPSETPQQPAQAESAASPPM